MICDLGETRGVRKGGTTIDIIESGNIHVDIFRRLLTADLVVADPSSRNAAGN
jgi:hypothetical protein